MRDEDGQVSLGLSDDRLEEANPSTIMTTGWVRGREAMWDTLIKAQGSGAYKPNTRVLRCRLRVCILYYMQTVTPKVLKGETVSACSTAGVREDRQTDEASSSPCLAYFLVLHSPQPTKITHNKILNCTRV